MTFLGILFYMAMVNKGEYQNYWGEQVEDVILKEKGAGLDSVMAIRRFKDLRRAFRFRNPASITQEEKQRDAAVRIRSLLNLFKVTGHKYLMVGRNLSVDEASLACRSKFGRHLIMFNPTKPGGKYHFRLYLCCCATTWVTLNSRLHCTSEMEHRLDGLMSSGEARLLRENSRVVNTDNYDTSIELLEALRVKGLYGRGTVRRISKHFPRHVILSDDAKRGERCQGVLASGIIGASWCDGNIVTIASNADASTTTKITRLVKNQHVEYSGPTCIKEYNKHMQGVDRSDQLRARFSVADGNSFKKWHKKLALGVVDLARVNGFLTRRIIHGSSTQRDAHRQCMVELISELLSGRWMEAPSDEFMIFDETVAPATSLALETPRRRSPAATTPPTAGSPAHVLIYCSGVSSKQIFKSRKKRQCVVWRYEGRHPTEVTDFCGTHNVCVCKSVHPVENALPFQCPELDMTCWEEFHKFYLPRDVFSSRDNLNKGSSFGEMRRLHMETTRIQRDSAAMCALSFDFLELEESDTSFDFA